MFTSIDGFNSLIWGLLNVSLRNPHIGWWLKYATLFAGAFYSFRQWLDFKFNKIDLLELITLKVLIMLFVFWLSIPANFVFLMGDLLKPTADDLATAIQYSFLPLQTDGGISGMMRLVLYSIVSLSPDTGVFSLMSLSFAKILGIFALIFFFKEIAIKLVVVVGLVFFADLGFYVIALAGIVMTPFFLIKETFFLASGFLKACLFLFFFVIILRVTMVIGVLLIMYGIFGHNMFNFVQAGGSLNDFIIAIATGQLRATPINYLNIWATFSLMAYMVFGFIMIASSLPLTMFIITGFGVGVGNSIQARPSMPGVGRFASFFRG